MPAGAPQHITDPSVSCHNFSVDSLMTAAGHTTRDGSPTHDPRSADMGGYPVGRPGSWGTVSPTQHYPSSTCLYPGQASSREELPCLSNQGYNGRVPSWYTMPGVPQVPQGGHSPNSIIPDQHHGGAPFSQQSREYFDGKVPSPGPPCQQVAGGGGGGYRSPYRTPYYAQDCDKY